MAILTQIELEHRLTKKRLVQLTNDSGGAEADPDVVAEVMQDTEAEIMARVGTRYDVTLLEPMPEVLMALAATIFEYKAYKRRNRTKIPEAIKDDYKMAREDLKAISKGGISLGKVPDPPQHPGRSAVLTTTTRRFSRTSLKAF